MEPSGSEDEPPLKLTASAAMPLVGAAPMRAVGHWLPPPLMVMSTVSVATSPSSFSTSSVSSVVPSGNTMSGIAPVATSWPSSYHR